MDALSTHALYSRADRGSGPGDDSSMTRHQEEKRLIQHTYTSMPAAIGPRESRAKIGLQTQLFPRFHPLPYPSANRDLHVDHEVPFPDVPLYPAWPAVVGPHALPNGNSSKYIEPRTWLAN
jgi:hypothetical protein